MVRELKGSSKDAGDTDVPKPSVVITIAHMVREFFGTLPGQRFMHGFTRRRNLLRVYLCDGAGIVASKAIYGH